RLINTTNAYKAARKQLGTARDTLAATRGELPTARVYDQTMPAPLEQAEQDLEQAKSEVNSGKAQVVDAREKAQRFLVQQATEGDPRLRALGSLLNGDDPSTYGLKMDYTSAVNEAQTARLKSLDASEVMLQVKREQVQRARNRVAE